MYTQLKEKVAIQHAAQLVYDSTKAKTKPINNEYIHNYSGWDLHNYCFFFRFVDASFIGGGLPLLHMAATSPFLAKVDA